MSFNNANAIYHHNPNYQLNYDPIQGNIALSGNLRLQGAQAYQEIMDVLEQASATHQELLLDLRGLEFLNSSGINMLAKFVISMRQHDDKILTIYGSNRHTWQRRSLFNLQRLMPTLHLLVTDDEIDIETRIDVETRTDVETRIDVETRTDNSLSDIRTR